MLNYKEFSDFVSLNIIKIIFKLSFNNLRFIFLYLFNDCGINFGIVYILLYNYYTA